MERREAQKIIENYIDRLIDQKNRREQMGISDHPEQDRIIEAFTEAVKALSEKRGHWMRDSEGETVCSECGKITMERQDEPFYHPMFGKGWAVKPPTYCSRCGSKMDEVEHGETDS